MCKTIVEAWFDEAGLELSLGQSDLSNIAARAPLQVTGCVHTSGTTEKCLYELTCIDFEATSLPFTALSATTTV